MTDIKSVAYIEKHKLDELLTIDDKGIISIPKDIHETTVLADAGISPEQHRKLQQGNQDLLAAVIYQAGTLSAGAMKTNPELTETSVSYGMGAGTTASVLFNREGKSHVLAEISTTVKSAEYKRVLAHTNQLFDDINS